MLNAEWRKEDKYGMKLKEIPHIEVWQDEVIHYN